MMARDKRLIEHFYWCSLWFKISQISIFMCVTRKSFWHIRLPFQNTATQSEVQHSENPPALVRLMRCHNFIHACVYSIGILKVLTLAWILGNWLKCKLKKARRRGVLMSSRDKSRNQGPNIFIFGTGFHFSC